MFYEEGNAATVNVKIYLFVKDAVRKNVMGRELTEHVFAATVKKWLRYAPDRTGGSGRKVQAHAEDDH